MELQELKIYKERLENEYGQLLDYRKRLLEQIRIEEQKLSSGGIASVFQGLNKDRKISELEKKIKEIQAELDKYQIKEDRTEEIASFKKRLLKDYEDALFNRDKTIEQSEAEKKKIEEAKQKEENLLSNLAEERIKESKRGENIKKENENFVNELENKKSELDQRENKVARTEEEIGLEQKSVKELKGRLESEMAEIEAERKRLKDSNNFNSVKGAEIADKLSFAENLVKEAESKENQLSAELADVQKIKQGLERQKSLLLLKEEGLAKREESILSGRKWLAGEKSKISQKTKDVALLEKSALALSKTIDDKRQELKNLESQKIRSENDSADNKFRLMVEYENLGIKNSEMKAKIESGQKQIEGLAEEKRLILLGLFQKHKESEKAMAEIQEKCDSLSGGLLDKEAKMKKTEEDITRAEFLLSEEKQKYEAEKGRISGEKEQFEQDKKAVVKEKSEAEAIKRALAGELDKETAKVSHLREIERLLEAKNRKEKKLLKEIKSRELRVKQKAEAVKKRDEFLNEKEEFLKKEQQHILSQQQQLKAGWAELKQREAKFN